MRSVFTVMFFVAQAIGQVQSSSPPTLGDIAAERLRELIPELQWGPDSALVANSTFRVTCNGYAATGFILLKPATTPGGKPLNFLISAGHFFRDCASLGREMVSVNLRYPLTDDPSHWDVQEEAIRIASKGHPLWLKHPRADVGIIPIELPDGVVLKPLLAGMLADSGNLRRDVYFNQSVFALGFPFATGLSGLIGFPMPRSGQVAQPSIDGKAEIIVAFQFYPGDSGGPVYAMFRRGNSFQILIIGLVARTAYTEQVILNGGGTNPEKWKIQQGVAYIAPSTDIAETIKMYVDSIGG
jgi:hypothetical protein